MEAPRKNLVKVLLNVEFLKLPSSGNTICKCNSLPIANFIFILQFLVEWFQGDHYFEHLCQHCHCYGTKCQQTSEDLGSWYIQHTCRCQGITFIQFNLPQTCLVVLWKPVVCVDFARKSVLKTLISTCLN